MELTTGIQTRRSIRGFLPTPVPRETLEQVLRLATRSVSSENTQPWQITVVTGETLTKICRSNMESLLQDEPADYVYHSPTGVYRRRSIDVAKQLFSAMDIARENREKRSWWSQRGYRFFDAPVGIVLSAEQSLSTDIMHFDLGCLTQNICLAAMEYGLGTCVAVQPVTYQKGLREHLHFPDSQRIVCAIAIGYPDWEFPANQVVSTREELDQVTDWYGFDEKETCD